MKLLILILFSLPLCVALSCSVDRSRSIYPKIEVPPCDDLIPVFQLTPDTVRFCGLITAETANSTMNLLRNTTSKKLLIDSLGGEIEPSLELARFLKDKDIILLVNRLCLSACAQYLALSVTSLGVRSDSYMGFHDTQYSSNLLVGEQFVDRRLRDLALKEVIFYREIGVSTEYLVLPIATLKPECVVNRETFITDGALRVRMTNHFVMPDEATFLDMYGGNLLSDWPTEESVEKTIEALHRSGIKSVYSSFASVGDYPLPECAE